MGNDHLFRNVSMRESHHDTSPDDKPLYYSPALSNVAPAVAFLDA